MGTRMKPLRLVFSLAALGLLRCGYSDTGTPDPGTSWWPWVCDDGGPAPDSGCLPTQGDAGPPDAVVDSDMGDHG
jgi:hypothetical protein